MASQNDTAVLLIHPNYRANWLDAFAISCGGYPWLPPHLKKYLKVVGQIVDNSKYPVIILHDDSLNLQRFNVKAGEFDQIPRYSG